ncbi:hypothetical protein ES703_78276 [subsurface metagenome]
MKTLTKIEVLEDAKKYYGIEKISNMILQNYIKKGLITRIDYYHEKGTSGSIAIYPKNTPGMLYLIRVMQDQGMKLKELKGYLSLFRLDREAIRDIEDIINEDAIQKKELLFSNGITPETRNLMLKKIPLKLLNQRALKITRFEKFKKIIGLRAYAELDYKNITEIIIRKSKDLDSFNQIQDSLDSPTIDINIDDVNDPLIQVEYSEPFNKIVAFTKNKSEIINS